MNIPDESLKKILESIQRLVYSKGVLTEKDREVIEIINEIVGDDRNEQ